MGFQRGLAAEQVGAAGNVQQHAVRRLQRGQRRVLLAPQRQRLIRRGAGQNAARQNAARL
jgi:hypothetical protein